VPGFPPENLAVLGDCPGGVEVCQEDWGRAVAVAAGSFPWLPEGESIRLVIPISDEGPWCGDAVTQDDLDSIAHAISVAQQNDVIVSPITGTGSGSAVITLAQEIAAATGGVHSSSSESVSEIAGGIADLVSQACAAFTDCDGNGTLDECDIALNPTLDFNGDGILDSCQQGQGISGADLGRALGSRLHAAYPNPFNPRTMIAFDLPHRQRVDLRVYDVSGRLVKVLAGGKVYEAGRHELVWNGRDDEGRRQAAGTYFFRMEADGQVQTRRVVMIK
jgi:hypothetical protein